MNRTVIGVDCSTGARKVGLARAVEADPRWQIHDVAACSATRMPVDTVAGWIDAAPDDVLLALDAPLGWPSALRTSLASHRAGAPIRVPANKLFRRATDEFVREKLNKQSLDVGADRIARTAHWALAFMDELRRATSEEIPLAWSPDPGRRVRAIEVYPAATLRSRRIATGSCRKSSGLQDCRSIVSALAAELSLRVPEPFTSSGYKELARMFVARVSCGMAPSGTNRGGRMAKVDLSEILELSIEDRIVLAQQIWDSVAADPGNVPLTDEQRKELEHRLQEYRKDPEDTTSWEVVERRLRSQIAR